MNDPEKSDPRIVATKPTNKAGRPGAELVEPRLGTKGNAGRQSTHRSQNRARVTQALDRVRHAARQRKKEQFTALLHHVNADALRTAFYALKRKAAAGVDGVTWQDYEADLELRLEDLHGRVPSGSLPTATIPPDVYTEGGRKAAARPIVLSLARSTIFSSTTCSSSSCNVHRLRPFGSLEQAKAISFASAAP